MDEGVWDAVVNGPFQPTKIVEGKVILKEFSIWTLDENKRPHYDVRAKNIISSALTLNDFYKVFVSELAKECGMFWKDAWGHIWGQEIKEEYFDWRVWNVQNEDWRKHLWCSEKIHTHSKSPLGTWQNIWEGRTQHQNIEEYK